MGKRKRAERRRAANEQTGGSQSPVPSSSQAPSHPSTQVSSKLNRGPGYVQATGERKTVANSDPYTGIAHLDARRAGVQHFMREQDFDPRRPKHEQQPIPYVIHTRQADSRGGEKRQRQRSSDRLMTLGTFAGGLEFSPVFVAYMSPVQPQLAPSSESIECWQWWRLDYLHKQVLKQFPSDEDRRGIKAILATRKGGQDMQDAATEAGLSLAQLARIERKIALFVRTASGLPGYIPPVTQVWHAPKTPMSSDVAGPMVVGEVAG